MNSIIYKNIFQTNYSCFIGLLLMVLCLTNCSNSENDQQKKDTDQMKVVNVSQLNPEQLKDWKFFFDNWLLNEFENCLKANNFKMDCEDCGSIYLDVQLEIDENGKLNKLKIVNEEIDCSQKSKEAIQEFKKCMLTYFEKSTYTKSLRNLTLEARLGKVTRC